MTTVVVGARSELAAALADALTAPVLDSSDALPARLDGVVIIVGAEPDLAPTELAHISESAWSSAVEYILHGTMHILQRTRAALLPGGGPVIVITPTVGMTGCAGLVPYTTAIEGVRAMAKSAARQWGEESISVNLIATPLQLLQPDLAYLTTHLTPPALGSAAAVLSAVVESARLLLGPAGAGITGATLVADGGSVMAP